MNLSRRAVQWGAIAVLLVLPLISRGSALYQAYGAGARNVAELTSPWENALYSGFSWLFGGLDAPAAAANLFQGGYWSITLFGVTVSDPLALLGYLMASGTVHWPLVAGAAFPIALAALAGRFFCGWICPINTILELNGKLRSWLERRTAKLRLLDADAPPRTRYLVLLGALGVTAVGGVSVFPLILPYTALARDWHLGVYGQAMGFGVLFLVILIVVELLFAPRIWCRSLCPTGLVLELIGRKRLIGIRREPASTCLSGCHSCISVCPVGVNPRDQIATESCLMCNACVDRCPPKILATGLAKGGLRPLVGIALVLVVLFPGTVFAHHIKGLPHYGYLENYPQVPTREQHVSAPPYELTIVTYALDGINRSRSEDPDDAMIYVSVTDTRTAKAYTGPILVTLRPAGGGKTIRRRFSKPLEETVYRMRVSLPARSYEMAIELAGAPKVVARTRLAREGGLNLWVAISLAIAGLALVAILLAYVRRRRRGVA